jgi:hypothetical protein
MAKKKKQTFPEKKISYIPHTGSGLLIYGTAYGYAYAAAWCNVLGGTVTNGKETGFALKWP